MVKQYEWWIDNCAELICRVVVRGVDCRVDGDWFKRLGPVARDKVI